MSFVIRHGQLVTPEGVLRGDLYCQNETIAAIGPDLQVPEGTREIEARDFWVLPGGIDAHTHCELPSPAGPASDDFYQAGAAAFAGGTTTIIDFVTPERGESLMKALDRWFEKSQKTCIDYAFHMCIPNFGPETAGEMKRLASDGINSFKIFMAYLATLGIRDDDILRVFDAAGDCGGLVSVHAENGQMVEYLQAHYLSQGKTAPKYHPLSRPPFVEAEAVNRVCALAKAAGQPVYIVHTSTADALKVIARARFEGQLVYSETCPQYLYLNDALYDQPDFEGAAFVMSPPLRPLGHQDALWHGLASGLVQTVATDHCPFMQATQKIRGIDDFTKIPNGGGGIENRMGLLFTGVAQKKLTIERMVDACATAPAKIFGLYPRKGALLVGADADLCLYDPRGETVISAKTHHMNIDRSIYEGVVQKGKVAMTFQRGRCVFDGEIHADRGQGRYLPRK